MLLEWKSATKEWSYRGTKLGRCRSGEGGGGAVLPKGAVVSRQGELARLVYYVRT